MTKAHQIDIIPSDQRVVVRLDGEVIADSDKPVVLHETGLPPRYYLPREHVRADVLRPSDTTTVCPFKGTASYHSVDVGGRRHEDLVWFYADPIPEAEQIRGLLAFYDDRVDMQVS